MNPMTTKDGQVDQILGSAYQVIKYVAANMETLITLAETVDPLVNSMQTAFEALRRTYAESGFDLLKATFKTGAAIGNRNHVLVDDTTGIAYSWGGYLPHFVPENSTLESSGGIGNLAWTARDLSSLRAELSLPNGVSLVGGAASAASVYFVTAQVREAIRRSYAEAGYNLVDGSFEAGGTLVSANDVLLHEGSGKAFTGPAGPVAAGTDPASGGFVDVSGAVTISEKVSYKDRTVASRLDDTRHLKDFWLAIDLDWTNAFERASQASKDGGFVVQCPPGVLTVSDSVVLYTDTSSTGGEFYKAKGSKFVGHARGTTVKKTVVGTKAVNATLFLQGGRGLQWDDIDIIDESAGAYGLWGSVDVSFSSFKNLFISTKNWGMWFDKPVYVGVEIENIVFAASATIAMQHGLRIPGGTTYKAKNISSFGLTGDAYDLAGSYVEVGPMACDDCAGIPYTFRQLDGSISALGVENINVPSIGTVIKVADSSSINIDVMFLFKVVQPANTSLIDCATFGRVKVGSIRGDGATVLNGKLTTVASGGSVEVAFLNKTPAQESVGQFNVGNIAGSQYVQRYGKCEFKYLRLPEAPQNDATIRYRIMGQLNGSVGCIGTITEARGDGQFPRSGMYDINVIGGPTAQYVRRVKRDVTDTTSNNYNAWYTATYAGKTYILCALDTNGTRNLGSYFSGIVDGVDPNLFKVVTAADVTGLDAYPSGIVLTETAS